MVEPAAEAIFRGPGAASPPGLPPGWGAIEVRFDFSRQAAGGTRGALTASALSNIWIPPPALLVDGGPRPASWSTWWYPVPAGHHEVEVREPGQASATVDVPVGQVLRLTYSAEIVVGAPGTVPGATQGDDVMVQEPGSSVPYRHQQVWHAAGSLS